MRAFILAAMTAALLACTGTAEAGVMDPNSIYNGHEYVSRSAAKPVRYARHHRKAHRRSAHRHHHSRAHYRHGRHRGYAGAPAGCHGIPWCGCYLRHKFGIRDVGLNLARNWAYVGHRAGGPGAGVIVVWPHHVGVIVGGSPGRWLVESGNDGGAVRTRARSVAGAIAFRRL